MPEPTDLASLRLEHFAALLEHEFDVSETPYSFRLLRVNSTPTRQDAPRKAFSLLFHSPVPAQQGLYALQHRSLGRLEMFLVPVAQDGMGVQLEAVFS
jgi:hypothetical protein